MKQPHPQPTTKHPGHLQARRLRRRRPSRRPPHPTPHKRGLAWQRLRRRKPNTPTIPHRNRSQPHAPKHQPKTKRQPLGRHRHPQHMRLPPSTTSTATSPTPPHLPNTQSATSRTSYTTQTPTTTRTSETILQQHALTKQRAPRTLIGETNRYKRQPRAQASKSHKEGANKKGGRLAHTTIRHFNNQQQYPHARTSRNSWRGSCRFFSGRHLHDTTLLNGI